MSLMLYGSATFKLVPFVFGHDNNAQPLGQPDRPEAALLGSLRASRSGGRLPQTLPTGCGTLGINESKREGFRTSPTALQVGPHPLRLYSHDYGKR